MPVCFYLLFGWVVCTVNAKTIALCRLLNSVLHGISAPTSTMTVWWCNYFNEGCSLNWDNSKNVTYLEGGFHEPWVSVLSPFFLGKFCKWGLGALISKPSVFPSPLHCSSEQCLYFCVFPSPLVSTVALLCFQSKVHEPCFSSAYYPEG